MKVVTGAGRRSEADTMRRGGVTERRNHVDDANNGSIESRQVFSWYPVLLMFPSACILHIIGVQKGS